MKELNSSSQLRDCWRTIEMTTADTLTSVLVSGPQHGTLSLQSGGGFTYTHDGSQSISDQFTYRVNDGQANSQTATVQLNILPVNDPPVAEDDSYALDEGATLNVPAPGVLDSDTDPDGDTLTATLVTGPLHGTLQLSSDGGFSYTHNGSETLQDSFTYQVDDNRGGTDTAVVTLNIRQIAVRGDFNGDGIVNVTDVDLLSAETRDANPDLRFDLSEDGNVDFRDLKVMIEDVLNTNFGDANLNGLFNSTDMIIVFQVGEYEDNVSLNSTWGEGDWNGDGDFTTSDMVIAFQSGAYETAAQARSLGVALVPSSVTTLRAFRPLSPGGGEGELSGAVAPQREIRSPETARTPIRWQTRSNHPPRRAADPQRQTHRSIEATLRRQRLFDDREDWIGQDIEALLHDLVNQQIPASVPADLVFADGKGDRSSAAAAP